MAKNNKSELDKVMDAMPVATFKNVHGEKFRIHRLGSFDLISGDEISAMVMPQHMIGGKYLPIFNPHFCIYSDDELESLGRAFIKLAQKARKNNLFGREAPMPAGYKPVKIDEEKSDD